MRLNRFLAAAGLGSRRSCEELIRTGQVRVNGAVCTELATQVEPDDVVKVGNRVLHTAPSRTLLIHKPKGFVTSASDEQGRRTVFDLLPPNTPRLFHVGRLDRESEGLLILTNDGDLSLKLTHPRYKIEKEYEVVLDKPFDYELSAKLLHGISTPEGRAKAEAVHRLAANKLKIVLQQGIKRQIRLMFYALGYEVTKLTRIRIGTLTIEGLPPAAWRVLTRRELDTLLASAKKATPSTPRKPKAPTASASGAPGTPPSGRKPHSRSKAATAPPRSKAPKSSAIAGSAPRSGAKAQPRNPRSLANPADDSSPGRSRRPGAAPRSPRRASR